MVTNTRATTKNPPETSPEGQGTGTAIPAGGASTDTGSRKMPARKTGTERNPSGGGTGGSTGGSSNRAGSSSSGTRGTRSVPTRDETAGGAPAGGGDGGDGSAGGGGGGGGHGGDGDGGAPPPPIPRPPAGPPPALLQVGLVLTVCGANANEIQVLENIERLNSLHAFGRMSKDDVTSLASRLEKRPEPNNISLPTSVVKNLQGLCFWASKARRQRRDITAADFDQVVLSDALDEMEIKAETDKAPEIKPEILKEEIWEDWSREFPTYLSHIIGKQQAPLDYVIRPEIQPGHVFQTLREQELYTYPLTGPFFHEDNKVVYRLLSDRVRDQPATWIQPYQASQNGRAARLALVAHYDGGGQKEKRINKAEAILSSVFYHNERAFSFDSYSTKLLRAFRTLEETPNRRSNANQVKILLDNIRIATAGLSRKHTLANSHPLPVHGILRVSNSTTVFSPFTASTSRTLAADSLPRRWPLSGPPDRRTSIRNELGSAAQVIVAAVVAAAAVATGGDVVIGGAVLLLVDAASATST